MKRQTRRQFLGAAGAGLAGVAWASFGARWGWALEKGGEGWLLLGDKQGGGMLSPGQMASLAVVNLSTQERWDVPVPCYAHSIVGHPKNRRRVLLLPQFEPIACEVDLVERKLVQQFHAGEGRSFYGHGAYSSDGKLVYAVESGTDLENGRISVRDAATFKLLGELDSHGIGPHECRLIDHGRKMWVANGGAVNGATGRFLPKYKALKSGALPSCVALIEVGSGKLIEKYDAEFPGAGAGHLDFSTKWGLAVGYRPTAPGMEGPLRIRGPHHRLVPLAGSDSVEKRMLGQALSLKICEKSGVVGVTNTEGGIVTFWSLKEKRLLKSFDIQMPTGLNMTLDGKYFVLTTFTGATHFIDPDTLKFHPEVHAGVRAGNGPHLLVWDPA